MLPRTAPCLRHTLTTPRIDKCQSQISNPTLARSERLGALQRQKVFCAFRLRACQRRLLLLNKMCACDELESTKREIETMKLVSRLFRASPSVEKVEQLTDRMNEMTDSLTEISSLLEAPDLDIDISEELEDLERQTLEIPPAPTTPLPENLDDLSRVAEAV